MSDAPASWSRATISTIADLQLGKMLDRARNESGDLYSYLRNINVRWFDVDQNDLFEMRFTAEEAERFSICDNDILVCEGGEPGRAAIWRGGKTELKFQKAIHRVRPLGAVAPEWVAYFLKFAADTRILDRYFTGSTIKHLPAQALARVDLPLPPTAEQRRIVARIEALQARSRKAMRALAAVPALIERYRRAVLDAILIKCEEQQAPWHSLAAISLSMRNGLSRKPAAES